MEMLEGLEPVRRGPYTGALGWIGPGRRDADEHPHPDVRGRRPAADAPRRRRHHLASDPAAEWDETVAKARGPLGAIGGVEVA